MDTIHAIFEDGVFRPTEPVLLPDKCEVEFEPRLKMGQPSAENLEAIYEVLDHRHSTGITDLAARHNEHQP